MIKLIPADIIESSHLLCEGRIYDRYHKYHNLRKTLPTHLNKATIYCAILRLLRTGKQPND